MSAPTRVRFQLAETLELQPIPDAIVWTDRLSVVYPGGTPRPMLINRASVFISAETPDGGEQGVAHGAAQAHARTRLNQAIRSPGCA